ncbi:MAG: hypothetical protein RLY31_1587 [Bacteroidota bacterium]|jgi:23S rRNA pseudouridine1911/1915/1917 synthase
MKRSSEEDGGPEERHSGEPGRKHAWQPGSLVVYRNNQLIAFNKPPGVPVQADKTGDKALLQLGEIFCKTRLYPLHRLDRPASGVVLFAKSAAAATQLGEQFRQRAIAKTYLAVVKELPSQPPGPVTHFLKKDGSRNRSEVSESEASGSRQADLSYRVLGSSEQYHLLEVTLHTGRHHQIRAQLGAMGSPVKGDVKYGARRGNRDRSVHLHAWKLGFRHPVSGEPVELQVPPPSDDPLWEAFRPCWDI